MAEWFRQLAPRERAILYAGAFLAVLIIGWRFVWSPLHARSAELEQQVSELTRLLVDVKRAATINAAAAATGTIGDQQLMTLVDQSARPLGLADTFDATRLDGADAMYVSFRNSPFDMINEWLTVLELEHGISVTAVSSISFAGTPGLVNGQVRIARL